MGENDRREAGILMPVSALPSSEGIGTLGKEAYAFVDWLQNAGMRIWQTLPLLPTNYGDSPYQSCAADALNPYLIDLETLENEGLLWGHEYRSLNWGGDLRRVDYARLFHEKTKILKKAFSRFDRASTEWRRFLEEERYEEYAIFMSLKERFSYLPWRQWAEPYRTYCEDVIKTWQSAHKDEVEFWQFTQYMFLRQWRRLKAYANEKGVSIMGDMPIYVADDSVECWKYRKDLFLLDEKGEPSLLAGVPPDAFSDDGQFWGNPVYDWRRMEKNGFSWWRSRIHYALSLFDCVRIDHFRAFDRFYAIPADSKNAKIGTWLDGPKARLFQDFPDRIVAEDLGDIDEGVRSLLKTTGYPGMKVFVFAFDGDPNNEYLPTNYERNCVAYTGTHDNDTLRSFLDTQTSAERARFLEILQTQCTALGVPCRTECIEEIVDTIVELLFASNADKVVFPMQDVLALDQEARINVPSTLSVKNWSYRFQTTDFADDIAKRLCALAKTYQRI